MSGDRMRGRPRGWSLVLALAVGAAVAVTPLAQRAGAAPRGEGELHPVTPARLLDTRSGSPVGPGGTVDVEVTGRAGIPGSGVLAVALDVTATGGSAATEVTAYPAGAARPRAVTLYAAAGEQVTAGAVVRVGTDGRVTLANRAGSVHLLADVTGWYGAADAPQGLRFHPFAPQPVLDTRTAAKPLGPGETRVVDLPLPLLPPSFASAWLLRVTVPGPAVATALTVFAAGTARPGVTSLSAPAGRTSSAVVAVPVTTSPYGGVALYNATGSAHVVVHVVGWADDRAGGDDGRYRPLPAAARLADTRNGTDVAVGPLASGGTVDVPVAGRAGVPYGATAALLTVAAVRPVGTGTLTAYPAGSPVPTAQQVGYAAGRPAASLVVAKLGPGGRVSIRASAGPVHVVVEVHGWYTGAGDYVPMPGGATAGGVVVDRASRYAYASNPALDRVEVVDLSSGTLLAPIHVGSKPAGLDLTPDGTLLYVTNDEGKDVSVVDVATRTELRRIPTGSAPTDIAIGAHGIAVLYVRAAFSDQHVTFLRLSDDRVYRSDGSYAPGTFDQGSLAASADREHIAIGSAGATPADLVAYDATADAVTTPGKFLLDGTRRVAASGDGTLLVGLPYLVDRVTHDVRRLPGQEPNPAYNSCTGAAFAPRDDVVYEACPGWVLAVATGDLGERGRVPYTGRVEYDYWVASGVAAGTPDGSRVLVVTSGGLALVPVGPPYT